MIQPLGPAARSRRSGRRTLLLLAAVTVAPVLASYAAYYLLPRGNLANYGELLTTQPAPPVAGQQSSGAAWQLEELRGQWVLAVLAPEGCAALCAKALYATRQARTIQGREMERLRRVLLDGAVGTTAAAVDPAQHSDLVVVRVDPLALRALPGRDDRILLLDPLGNLVLSWPADPDIKALARDLTRLLKASRIG